MTRLKNYKTVIVASMSVSLFLFLPALLLAQSPKYSTFYYQRASLFEKLPVTSKDVVFLGNSITNGGEWMELLGSANMKNRGISGDVTMGVYDRLEPVIDGEPDKIFLLIGINDLARDISEDTIVANIGMILDKIRLESPLTRVYLQSIMPVNDHFGMFGGATKKWSVIKTLNERLKLLAESKNAVYVDLFTELVEPGTEKLNLEYTNDGLHLMGDGYLKWAEIIKPYLAQ